MTPDMAPEDIKALLEAGIDGAEALVQGDGYKYELVVIAEVFTGLSPVKKQQLVYGCINAHIADGSIHAVDIKTFTPAEWEQARRRGLA